MIGDVSNLSLTEVATHCADESEKFRSSGQSDSRFCFELFRRAVVDRHEDAWAYILAQYERLVLRWIYAHPSFAFADEPADAFLVAAFERFWRAVSAEKFGSRFTQLGSVLKYLKLCVGATIVDHARKQQREAVLQPIDTVSHALPSSQNVEASIQDRMQQNALWQQVASVAKNEQEQVVLKDAMLYNFAASEIATRHPQLFSSVKQVYRVKENLLKRLRRNPQLRAMAE